MAQIKTTNKDFELFKNECYFWINFWGLDGWDIGFTRCKLNGNDAQCSNNVEARWAYLKLSTTLNDYDYGDNFIRRLAFHEVAHILFADIVTSAISLFGCSKMIEKEEHRLINKMWRSLKQYRMIPHI